MRDKRSEYRIVKNNSNYWNYKAQYKPWWSPFWFDCWNVGNVRSEADSIKDLEEFALKHAQAKQTNDLNTIKKLGKLP